MIRAEPRRSTAPASIPISVRGFADEQRARAFGERLGAWLHELGRRFDLSALDGVTVAADYAEALQSIDRGFVATRSLAPTREHARGVAMAVPVLCNGFVKSHLVLDLNYVAWLEDSEADGFSYAVHLLAHECAHVEVTAAYDRCFPGVLLRKRISEAEGWSVGIAGICWDEFAATSLCAGIGHDPTNDYETTFVSVVANARDRANEKIVAYRSHGDTGQVVGEVFGIYGDVLKFASYVAGNMHGRRLSIAECPDLDAALSGHWFQPYFERLQLVCGAIADGFGAWSSTEAFDALSILVDDVVRSGGVILTRTPNGGFYADIPFTAETLPRAS